VWDIVFPGRPRPRSAYLDARHAAELWAFCEYCRAQGPAVLDEQLRVMVNAGAWTGPEALAGEERREILEWALDQGLEFLFGEWSRSWVAETGKSSAPLADSGGADGGVGPGAQQPRGGSPPGIGGSGSGESVEEGSAGLEEVMEHSEERIRGPSPGSMAGSAAVDSDAVPDLDFSGWLWDNIPRTDTSQGEGELIDLRAGL
jgi:hypothetical protein